MATVVATTYGSLPEFDAEIDSVKFYTARARVYFKANSIPEDKQAATFLSCIGGKTYDLLDSLLSPTPLDESTFDVLSLRWKGIITPSLTLLVSDLRFTREIRNRLRVSRSI